MLSIAINILLAIHVLVSLLIILLVLMQRPKNEGLGAAFGGGMTENLFGAQTTNVLQTITRWLGGIFFLLTVTLSFLYVKHTTAKGGGSLQQRLTAPTIIPKAPESAGPAGVDADKLKEEIQKAIDAQKNAPAPEKPEATTPPVKPGEPAPAPAPEGKPAPAPEAAPAPAPKPENPAPAAEKPAAPEKAPEQPPK
jgi:preprotein translocase subunit SecG